MECPRWVELHGGVFTVVQRCRSATKCVRKPDPPRCGTSATETALARWCMHLLASAAS